jgi:hypothetical protein
MNRLLAGAREVSDRHLSLPGIVDRVPEDPHGLLRGVEPHGVLRLHGVEQELRPPVKVPRARQVRVGPAGLARRLQISDERHEGV